MKEKGEQMEGEVQDPAPVHLKYRIPPRKPVTKDDPAIILHFTV
jgi:hypothetical protein